MTFNTARQLLALVAIAALLLGVGCGSSEKPPVINGCHWREDFISSELYNADGEKIASVVGGIFNEADGVQVCIFDSNLPCRTFETKRLAFDWLASVERKAHP